MDLLRFYPLLKVEVIMCQIMVCDNCNYEYEVDFKKVKWTKSGTALFGDEDIHWAEGEINCPQCNEINYINISD